jgi:hypothetical protein
MTQHIDNPNVVLIGSGVMSANPTNIFTEGNEGNEDRFVVFPNP